MDVDFCLCMINKFASLGSVCLTRPYGNFHFIQAGYTTYGIENPPSSPFTPLRRGIKGEDWGCRIAQKKHNPPEPPFVKGDLSGTTRSYWTQKWIQYGKNSMG